MIHLVVGAICLVVYSLGGIILEARWQRVLLLVAAISWASILTLQIKMYLDQ